jgi:hypothetical protein
MQQLKLLLLALVLATICFCYTNGAKVCNADPGCVQYCTNCTAGSSCTACCDGYKVKTESGTQWCKPTCSGTTYVTTPMGGGATVDCPDGCSSCYTSGSYPSFTYTCTSCCPQWELRELRSGFSRCYSPVDENIPPPMCRGSYPQNEYYNQTCMDWCQNCHSSQTCDECCSGYGLSPDKKQCANPNGTKSDGGPCDSYSNEYKDKEGLCRKCYFEVGNCASCQLDSNGEFECTFCFKTHELVNNQCVPKICPEGTAANPVNSQYGCENCKNGCKHCNYTSEGVHCLECHDGFEMIEQSYGGPTCEKMDCQQGYVFQKSTLKCEYCGVSSCQTCDSQHTCLTCQYPYVLTEDRTACLYWSSVLNCTKYQYPYSGSMLPYCRDCSRLSAHCETCDEGGYTCLTCPKGRVLSHGSCVDSCSGDHYMDDETQQCVQCPLQCTKCSGPTNCTECSSAMTLTNGTCTSSCPTGQYSQYKPAACPPCFGTGSFTCQNCSDIEHCLECREGVCYKCEDGYTNEDGVYECNPECKEGEYGDSNEGKFECKNCSTIAGCGKCSRYGCIMCLDGYEVDEEHSDGTVECEKVCPIGYKNEDGECVENGCGILCSHCGEGCEKCVEGYKLHDGICFNGSVCDEITSTTKGVCSGHGTCVADNVCQCDTGYSGSVCEKTTCFGIESDSDKVCGGKGECVKLDKCCCNVPYGGFMCQREVVHRDQSKDHCQTGVGAPLLKEWYDKVADQCDTSSDSKYKNMCTFGAPFVSSLKTPNYVDSNAIITSASSIKSMISLSLLLGVVLAHLIV